MYVYIYTCIHIHSLPLSRSFALHVHLLFHCKVSKETQYSVKRDLVQCLFRSTCTPPLPHPWTQSPLLLAV